MADITIHASNCSQITCISNVFIDTYMREANGEYVKIYLYLLRCLGQDGCDISISAIADHLDHTEKDIRRALSYWESKGLLKLEYDDTNTLRGICLLDCTPAKESAPAAPVCRAVTPEGSCDTDRKEDASDASCASYTPDQMAVFLEDESIRELLMVTEAYFKRPLKTNEMHTILYWYDGLGFSTDLIEYLVTRCIDCNHASIHYMNKIALDWADKHYTTVAQARQEADIHSQAAYAVKKAFGISGRNLVEAETSYIEKWTGQYGFSLDIITEACKRTVMTICKPNFAYADTILTKWHEKNVRHIEDITPLGDNFAGQTTRPSSRTATDNSPRTTGSSRSNRFHNFPQRQYDYDALEQQLLQK